MKTVLSLLLSILPGLGHLIFKKYRKAFSYLCMSAGALAVLVFPGWVILKLVAAVIYFSLLVNAAFDIYLIRSNRGELHENKKYIALLLLTNGFSALPMLWNSSRFSLRAKIAWSAAVPVLALIFFWLLFEYSSEIETWINNRFQ